jgi:hypothetical protein
MKKCFPIIILFILYRFYCLSQNIENEEIKFWQIQNSKTEVSFRGLSVLNEKIVWVSGAKGTVLKTTDGGINWIKVEVPDGKELDFRDVEVIDENNILLLPAGNTGKIFRTSDAGMSWSIVFNNQNKGVFFDGMAFWDKKSGMAFSDPINGSFLIIYTNDGGKIWKEIDRDILPKPLEGEAAFAASGTSLCTLGKNTIWIGLGGANESRILRSTDKGKLWSVFATPVSCGASSKGIFSVSFRIIKTVLSSVVIIVNLMKKTRTALLQLMVERAGN